MSFIITYNQNLLIKFFSKSNRVYLKKRIKQRVYPYLFRHNKASNPPYPIIKDECHALRNRLNDKMKKNKEISLNEIIKSDFFSNDIDIEKKIRANDFFHILNPEEKINEVFKFLKIWFNKYNRVDIFPLSDILENSIRLNNLIWFYNLHFDSIDIEEKQFLTNKIIYLSDLTNLFLEVHLNNNHTLIQSKNLLISSLLFQNDKCSKNWQINSIKILTNCLDKQISEDGIHIERSSMYQKVIFSELLELVIMLNNNKEFVDETFLKLLSSKIFLLSKYDDYMTYDKETFSLWGDGYVEDRLIRHVDILRRNDNESLNIYNSIKEILAPKKQKSKDWEFYNFNGFNYFISSKMLMIFNSGCDLSMQNFAKGHLHSDLLGYTLNVNNREVINNSGTFNYNLDSIKYFRGTRGHNTIMIDGKEQHGFQMNENLKCVANGYTEYFLKKANKMEISSYHDGYRSIGVTHFRKISFKKNSIKIIDNIVGHRIHKLKYFIHLDSNINCKLIEKVLVIDDIGEITFKINEIFNIELFDNAKYDGAWVSKKINEKKGSKVLIISGSFNKNIELVAKFRLYD